MSFFTSELSKISFYRWEYLFDSLKTSRHKIERPKQDVDFVSVPEKNPPRKLFVVILEPATNFRCLKCPEPKSLRLWSLRSLLAHLSDKWAFTHFMFKAILIGSIQTRDQRRFWKCIHVYSSCAEDFWRRLWHWFKPKRDRLTSCTILIFPVVP